MHYFFHALLLAMCLFSAINLDAQPNRRGALTNPGFEDGLLGWTREESPLIMSKVVDTAAHSGLMGLRIQDSSARVGSSLASARGFVRSGETVVVSFYGRLIEGDGIAVYLRFFDASGKYLNPAPVHHDLIEISSLKWTLLAVEAVAPVGATKFDVWIHSYNGKIVTAEVDDFEVDIFTSNAKAISAAMRQEAAKPLWIGDTDKLPTFPKLSPELEFFATGLKVIQPSGAFLRTPRENWIAARARIASDPNWAQWLEEKRAAVDKWMSGNQDRIQWKAGWYHDFVSPKNGSFLVWDEAIPGEQIDHFTSSTGEQVAITEKNFAAWVMVFRNRNTERMVDAARLFRLGEGSRYAQWAANQLDFYADNYEQWPVTWEKKHPARLGIQALDDAVLLSNFIETARLLFEWADPERRQKWYTGLFAPAAEMLGESYQVIHNIAVWMRSAQAQVALLYRDQDLWRSAVEGPYGLRDQLQRGVTSDYFWYEQSFHYGNYVVRAVLPVLIFAGLTQQGDRLAQEAAIIQNLLISPLLVRFPDQYRLPSPSDANATPRVPFSTLAAASRVIPTSVGLIASETVYDWSTLVDDLSDMEKPSDPINVLLPEVVSRNMESSRFTLLKKGPWQVFFHFGQLFRSHAQNEILNWSASFEAVDITHDPGTPGYGAKISSEYFRRGLNHNVPLINAEGQANWNRGKLIQFESGSEGSAAVASAEVVDYRTGFSARRTLRIVGDELEDEVILRATTTPEEPARVGIALHLQGVPRLPKVFQADTSLPQGRSRAFSYWKDVTSSTFVDRAELPVVFPSGRVLRLEIIHRGAFTLYHGLSPDMPGQRAGFYLESANLMQKEGDNATFITRLSPLD